MNYTFFHKQLIFWPLPRNCLVDPGKSSPKITSRFLIQMSFWVKYLSRWSKQWEGGTAVFEKLQHYLALAWFGTKYSRMDQVKFFKGCLPQILLCQFLNTWTYLCFHLIHFQLLLLTLTQSVVFKQSVNCATYCVFSF